MLMLTPARIMLEISNFVRKYTKLRSFRKYTFQYQDFLNFPDVSTFLQKNQRFCEKIVPLLKEIL